MSAVHAVSVPDVCQGVYFAAHRNALLRPMTVFALPSQRSSPRSLIHLELSFLHITVPCDSQLLRFTSARSLIKGQKEHRANEAVSKRRDGTKKGC